MNIKKQLIQLHIYNAFIILRITDAVWVTFLLQRGFTLAQVGIAEGIFHVVSFVAEVPSGVVADLLGRRRTLVASGICGICSALLMAYSLDFVGVCVALAVKALMYNLASGTQEAITYDSLVQAECEGEYLHTSTWLNGVAQTVSALGCMAGGFALWLGYVNAYLLSSVAALIATVAAFFMAEPTVTQLQQSRTTHPLRDLKTRLRSHVRASVDFLRSSPRSACKIAADAAAAVPIYLTFMLLQQHLLDDGLPALWIGIALLAVRLCGTGGLALSARLKSRLFPVVVVCAALVGVGTVFAGSSIWPVALAGACVASAAICVSQLRTEVSLNNAFPSDQRATLMSVSSMVYSMLMILVSPVAGAMADKFGAAWTLRGLGIALLAVLPISAFAVYRYFQRKDTCN